MDANEFWAWQLEKNKRAVPKFEVYTEADAPQEKWMSDWIEKWREQFAYFNNAGCGCCVNFYEFDAPIPAIEEIPDEGIEVKIYEPK